jgi:peptidyl-prolyl cis-trans isomerase SurA
MSFWFRLVAWSDRHPLISRRFLLATTIISAVAIAHADPPNGIRAVVHDSVITSDEVDLSIEEQYRTRPETFRGKLNELRAAKLDELINRQLILHEFKTAMYNLPESIVDELVQEEIQAKFRDRVTATKTLNEQGITYEKFRQRLRDQFIITALRQKNVASEIIISPHKIETFYAAHKDNYKVEDQVKLRMIEIKANDSSVPNPQKMAEEIVLKLKQGASFDEMASQKYNSRTQRGAETFQVSQLRKELAETATKLKAGEAEVANTPEAFYVILLEEAKGAHVKPLSEVRAEIEKDLLSQERARLDKQWIDRLKKKTFYRYF